MITLVINFHRQYHSQCMYTVIKYKQLSSWLERNYVSIYVCFLCFSKESSSDACNLWKSLQRWGIQQVALCANTNYCGLLSACVAIINDKVYITYQFYTFTLCFDIHAYRHAQIPFFFLLVQLGWVHLMCRANQQLMSCQCYYYYQWLYCTELKNECKCTK